jgi:type I restriction enzyme S subunit
MAKQTDSKVPEIRIKGFSGEWEDKPIGKILSETKRPIVLEDNQQYELVTVKRRNGGVVSRGHLWGREILVKNYSQLQTGDFLISKRQVVHGATGIVPAELNKAIVSNEYLVAIGNNEITTEFLTILASLPDMRKKFFLSSYGVDIEKLFFDAEDWKKRCITIPQLPEQTQIVEYFHELDSLIGLHQRKHDKLVTLKKAMLQKMFPQAEATTPEIRFEGFSGEWTQKKLGEVGTFNPKEALPEVFEYVDLESVVGTEMVSHRTETRKTAPSRAQRLARQGDLFFQTVRPYQKNNHLFTLPFTNYVFSTGYAQIRPINDGNFLLGS